MRCGQGRVKNGSYPEITYLCTGTIKVFILPSFLRLSVDLYAALGMLAIGDVKQLSPNASIIVSVLLNMSHYAFPLSITTSISVTSPLAI